MYNCLEQNNAGQEAERIISITKKCNYPSALIEDGIKKALSFDRNTLLYPIVRDVDNNIIVHVSSYNPNYDSHSNIVKQMFDELKVSKFTKYIFANKKLIQSKRQPPNLKNILTQAKFCTVNKQCVSKCNSPRCQLCEIIIQSDYFRFKNVNYNFIEHVFRIMSIYKVKEDDTDLRRNMEEYLINKLKPDLNS